MLSQMQANWKYFAKDLNGLFSILFQRIGAQQSKNICIYIRYKLEVDVTFTEMIVEWCSSEMAPNLITFGFPLKYYMGFEGLFMEFWIN